MDDTETEVATVSDYAVSKYLHLSSVVSRTEILGKALKKFMKTSAISLVEAAPDKPGSVQAYK